MSEDMAEQDTDQHYKEDKEGETQSTNMDHVFVSPSEKQEETDPNVKQQLSENSASSSASTNTETDHDNGEDMEKHDGKVCDSTEEKIVPEKLNTATTTTKGSSPPDKDGTLNVKKNSNQLQPDEGSHGDSTGETAKESSGDTGEKEALGTPTQPTACDRKNEQGDRPEPKTQESDNTDTEAGEEESNLPDISGPADPQVIRIQGDTGEKKALGTATQPTPCDRKNEQGDGPEPKTQEGDNTDTEAGEEESNLPDISGPADPQVIRIQGDTGEKKAPRTLTPPPQEHQVDGPTEESPDRNDTDPTAGEDDGSISEADEGIQEDTTSPRTEKVVETIGSITTQETEDAEPAVIGNQGGIGIYLIVGILVLVVAVLVSHLQPESPSQKDGERQIDIFLRQLEKVKTQFPNQRAELWKRSKIHLLRHLQTAQPTEPVSLILTAGHRAERTLHCLAQSLASSFSSALNASVLHIDGASKASQDSDQVKLDIDSKLQGAFEGDKPVAVINRFEELPPGSTLIFYRYCDHENAAYKKTCLIFTVLLGEEEEIPAETRLSTVEEMVDDHLQKKFLSDGHPVSFDRMDLDKYGGLWSRISHLILPVAAEERIESEGC